MKLAFALVFVGFLLIVAGLAVFSPAIGAVAAGVMLLAAGLYFDFEE